MRRALCGAETWLFDALTSMNRGNAPRLSVLVANPRAARLDGFNRP